MAIIQIMEWDVTILLFELTLGSWVVKLDSCPVGVVTSLPYMCIVLTSLCISNSHFHAPQSSPCLVQPYVPRASGVASSFEKTRGRRWLSEKLYHTMESNIFPEFS